tara:strand:- start:380 stop:772 length:393 start_codon:yes stop_codon:yes gene_type:complete
MISKLINLFNSLFPKNIFLVRLHAKNNKHAIYIPACYSTAKLADCNEKPYLLESDFGWMMSINKRYRICIYTEEHYKEYHEHFKATFSDIFFKYLSKYSNAKHNLLVTPRRIKIDQPIVGISINRPGRAY